MAYFPLFVNITGEKCLVAGGGKVARRKVETLLKYGADVYVAAAEFCPEIKDRLPEDHLLAGEIFLEKLMPVLQESFLVVAATSSHSLNTAIAKTCRELKLPVNVADNPEESGFIFPAVVKKGEISIGINSGTASPLIAKKIRKNIETAVPDHYAEIAVWMGELRSGVKKRFGEESVRRKIIKAAAAQAFSLERVLTEKEIEEIIREETQSL